MKFKVTLVPNLCVFDLLVLIKKQPSPVTKPATHCLTSDLFNSKVVLGTSGLVTGIILGKAVSNLSGKH